MVTCYLGIGSNLGNRGKNIRLAIQKIRALKNTELLKTSGIIETKPMGGPRNQGKFLNAAIKIKTKLTPHLLLKKLKQIETELGRAKTIRYGPRVIDLDILFYADKIINRNNLKIPHPKVFKREFVIRPLLEIV
ncbi:MAG: 2-amino-4-hydroxy-6-hydroxymethyldihydropteridine diphosphokinase [Omnitrophica WOR_2 bacterium RBG_13_41_10]|nr:MAG: 2-amino-4-hydroxy-6-hydroxymethyldihydropteridine diphosphokinase [Omnitrophica WOR_2 bacterium RBG_13_41_10]